jgi:hypothetical protein
MTQSIITPEELSKHNAYDVTILRYVTMFATGESKAISVLPRLHAENISLP